MVEIIVDKNLILARDYEFIKEDGVEGVPIPTYVRYVKVLGNIILELDLEPGSPDGQVKIKETTGTTLSPRGKERFPKMVDQVYGFKSPFQSPRRSGEMATGIVKELNNVINAQALEARLKFNED